MWHHRHRNGLAIGAVLVAVSALVWFGMSRRNDTPEVAEPVTAAAVDQLPPKDKRVVSDEQRAALLQRAHVWRPPRTPIDQAGFDGVNLDEVTCRFEVDVPGGTTPKFDCVFDSGEEIRIKYGNGPEAPAETAATRLLRTVGFGADDVTLVRTLRCFGCPMEPFSVMKAVEITGTEPLYERVVDYDDPTEFTWVALERKLHAWPVETETVKGWSFHELDAVQAAGGGAPRAHIDGLRLMAVLLAHWDNKAENQRLVCLSERWPEDTPCREPFLLLQDVGATFGPTKMDFDAWQRVPMWEDRASCTVSMRDLPYAGATFGAATITEAGRQFVGGLLAQLSDDQLTALFASARFGDQRGWLTRPTPVADWVRVFKQKVRAITDGPPCPPR
jgi:hypothetical protein